MDELWAIVIMVMNIWVVLDVWNLLTSFGTTSVSRKAVLHGVNYEGRTESHEQQLFVK